MQLVKTSDRFFWFLLFLSVALLFPSLGKVPLWIYDEVRNAECAREMWERHDWVVPTFNGTLRTLKPPLHYYFMFGGFRLFGITEWGARFFSALFGVFTILATYYFVKRYSSPLHAFITALVLLASTHFLFQFRMSVPDPYLIFFNTLSLFTAYAYFKEKIFGWLLISAASFGLGALTKGPVAIALPCLALLCWLIWQRNWKAVLHPHIAIAALVSLVIAVPWYVAIHMATNGEWTRGFFLQHNLGRFSEPMEGHGGFFLIVPLFVWVLMLPATVFIGESLRQFRQRFADPFLRLALCVVAVFIVFYGISGTKLPNYPTPCYPFLAMLLGFFITGALQGNLSTRNYPLISLLFINTVLPIGLYLGIRNEVALTGLQNNALIALLLTAGSLFSIYLYRQQGFKVAVVFLMIIYTVFNSIFFNYLYPAIYNNNPLSKTFSEVKKYDHVVAWKLFQPSFTYYLPRRVPVFDRIDSLRAYLQVHKALIISRQSFLPELDSLRLKKVAAHHDLFERSTTILLTNRLR